MALKYFKNTEANINDVLIMIGDFNIRDSSWDPLLPNHLIHSDTLTDIANSLNLNIFSTIVQVPTRYTDNTNDLNSIIDLMFLQPNSDEFDDHTIYSE